jgi:hypothetical protein
MGMVKDYIDDWKASVVMGVALRFGRWPEPRSDEWRPVFRALCDANATRDLADRVRDRLADNPPANFADAIVAFQAAIKAEQQSPAAVGDREQAISASMSCGRDPDTGKITPCRTCHGSGLGVFVRTDGERFDVKTPGGLHRLSKELVMTCGCPHGRWIAAQPKCPYSDSTRYGGRIVDRATDEAGEDIPRPETEKRAAAARRMVNDSIRAA